jgi:hypothetical protein
MGHDETTELSHDHRANQQVTRTEVLMALKRGSFAGVEKRQGKSVRVIRLIGNIQNKMARKRGRPSSTDVEDRLNGELHLIQVHDGMVTKDCAVCSKREVKGG